MNAPPCAACSVPGGRLRTLGYDFHAEDGFFVREICPACGSMESVPASLQDVELFVAGLTDRAAARTAIALVRALEATLDRGGISGPVSALEEAIPVPFLCAHGRDINERCVLCEQAPSVLPCVPIDVRRSRGRVRTFHRRPR